MAGLFNVRGVAEQGKHALVPKLSEARDVYHAAGDRRNVYFEVSGMDDRADGRAYRQRNGVGNAVVHMNELYGKAAQPEARAGLFREYLRIVEEVMLLKLQLHQRSGQRRRVDGDVKLTQYIRDSADMVLMSMGQDDTAHALRIGLEVADIGKHDVDTVHILVRKAHAAVNDNDVASELIGRHILAYFAKPPKGNDFQF